MSEETDKLAEEIGRLSAAITAMPKIPVAVALWDSELVAAYLCCSRTHFLQRIAPKPDFPRPIRKIGHPRWKARDVIAWAEQEKAA